MKLIFYFWVICIMFPALLCAAKETTDLPAQNTRVELYIDRSGFNEGLLSNTLLSGYLGVALGAVIDGSFGSDRAYSGGILGSGIGFGTTFLLTKGGEMKTAPVVLGRNLALAGIADGFLVWGLLGGEDVSESSLGTLTGILGATGLLAGYKAANYMNVSAGQADFLGYCLTYGTIAGGLASSFAELSGETIAASALIGQGIGGIVSLSVRPKLQISRYRVFWMHIGTVIGMITGYGLGMFINPDADNAQSLGTLAGMLGGIFLSFHLSEGVEEWKQRIPINSAYNFGESQADIFLGLPSRPIRWRDRASFNNSREGDFNTSHSVYRIEIIHLRW